MFPILELTQLPSVPLVQRINLPSYPGIYFALDATNRVLYIGQASNLLSRWQGQSHHRIEQLMRLNKKSPVRIAWLDCSDHPTLLTAMETHYIAAYNPLLNRTQVPPKKITPSEVALGATLGKIAKYTLIFGIVPSQEKQLPLVCLKYLTKGGSRETTTLRRMFEANNRKPTGLRWTETTRRKYGAWWKTGCNGVLLELGPWISFEQGALRLAGIELLALQQPALEALTQEFPFLLENYPRLLALESDPIPLVWTRLS
jgi:hypothetical protein